MKLTIIGNESEETTFFLEKMLVDIEPDIEHQIYIRRFDTEESMQVNYSNISRNSQLLVICDSKLNVQNISNALECSGRSFPIIILNTPLHLREMYFESSNRQVILPEIMGEDLYPISFKSNSYGIRCNGNFIKNIAKSSSSQAPLLLGKDLLAGRFIGGYTCLLSWSLKNNTPAASYLTITLAKLMIKSEERL